MKLLQKDTDKRPDSTKAAEVAGATLAFLGKKQLVKVKHYMYATLSMDRSIRNKYLTPEACFGICVICCDETAPGNDDSDETDDPELKNWVSCDLCGCWAHQSCMSEQARNGKAEMTLSPTGHGTISAQCPSCTEYKRLDPLCVEVTSKDAVLRLLDGCESTVQSVLRDGTGILANKLPDNFRERLISSGFHYVLDLVQEGLDIVRNKLCFVPADMVDNTLRYLMIGPVGAGKSLKGDLMCIRAPGDPTQYHQDAPCSLPDDFIKTQLQAGRKSSQIIRDAIEFPKEDVMKSLFDESGKLRRGAGVDNLEINDEVTKETLLRYMREQREQADKKVRGALLPLDAFNGERTSHTSNIPIDTRQGRNCIVASTFSSKDICQTLEFMRGHLQSLQDYRELNQEEFCKAIFVPDPEEEGAAKLPLDKKDRFCESLVWECLKDDIKSFFGNSSDCLGVPVKIKPYGEFPGHDRLYLAAIICCFHGIDPCYRSTTPAAGVWKQLQRSEQPWMHLIKELTIWNTTFLIPRGACLQDSTGAASPLTDANVIGDSIMAVYVPDTGILLPLACCDVGCLR